jgi:hypothetical protein
MNYYLDQEFHEYFRKPIPWLPTIGNFNKPFHTIELISIGIVAEDGREYYSVCNEFNLKAAEKNKWLNENVLTPITVDFYRKEGVYAKTYHWESLTLKNFLKWKGKSKAKIAEEIRNFVCNPTGHPDPVVVSHFYEQDHPKFYGYYADYDWVVFCSMFGTMMDLPKGFPMYCRDLKQLLDDKATGRWHMSHQECIEKIKQDKNYPKQENEHHALADAKWNKKLHEFLKSL